MPRLPSSIGQLPTPRGSSPSISVQPSGAGTAYANAGNVIANLGEQLQRHIQNADFQASRANVENAYNNLLNKQLTLTEGDVDYENPTREVGFKNIIGGDAITKPLVKDYLQKYDDQTKSIQEGLGNDLERQEFKVRADASRLHFAQQLMQHRDVQNKVYQKQTFENTVDTQTRLAVSNYDDPNAVNASATVIKGVLDNLSQTHPELANEYTNRRVVGNLYSSVIRQALANDNYIYANKLYNEHKDDIDPTTSQVFAREVGNAELKQSIIGYETQIQDQQDNFDSLNKISDSVMKDGLLDEPGRHALMSKIITLKNSIVSARDKMLEQNDTELRKDISDTYDYLHLWNGNLNKDDPKSIQNILIRAKGTKYEEDAANLAHTAYSASQIRGLPIQEQRDYVNKMQSSLGAVPSEQHKKTIDLLKSIVDEQEKQIQTNPTGMAIKSGWISPNDPASKPITREQVIPGVQTKDDIFPLQLRARYRLAEYNAQVNGAPYKPLQPEEARDISSTLNVADSTTVAKIFGRLMESSGSDRKGYIGIMQQLAPDNPVYAHAGVLAASNDVESQKASDLAIRGWKILNPPKKEDGSPPGGSLIPIPSDSKFESMFSQISGEAYAGLPQARSISFQTAKSIYAALASDNANTDANNVDQKMFNDAVLKATGGILKINGKETLMPYNMQESEFKTQLHRHLFQYQATGQLPEDLKASELEKYPVQAVGPDQYAIVSGDGKLQNLKNGNKLVIDLKKPIIIDEDFRKKTKEQLMNEPPKKSGPVPKTFKEQLDWMKNGP